MADYGNFMLDLYRDGTRIETRCMTDENVNDYDTFILEILKTYPSLKRKNIRLEFNRKNGDAVKVVNNKTFEGYVNYFKNKDDDRVINVLDERLPSRQLRFEDSTHFNYEPPIKHPTTGELPELGKKRIHTGGKTNGIFLIAQCENEKTEKSGLKDFKKYKEIGNYLGFSREFGNLIEVEGKATWFKMEKELENCKKFEISKLECFILVFIGHGSTYVSLRNGYLYQFEESLSLENDDKKIIDVDLKFLVDKIDSLKLPKECAKIILLEACRGGVDEVMHKIHERREFSEETSTTNMENLVICYATIPNKRAWCDNDDGSVFTKHFYNEMMKDAKNEEFSQLLTRVNDLVNNDAEGSRTHRQLSCFRSSLTTELYFSKPL